MRFDTFKSAHISNKHRKFHSVWCHIERVRLEWILFLASDPVSLPPQWVSRFLSVNRLFHTLLDIHTAVIRLFDCLLNVNQHCSFYYIQIINFNTISWGRTVSVIGPHAIVWESIVWMCRKVTCWFTLKRALVKMKAVVMSSNTRNFNLFMRKDITLVRARPCAPVRKKIDASRTLLILHQTERNFQRLLLMVAPQNVPNGIRLRCV